MRPMPGARGAEDGTAKCLEREVGPRVRGYREAQGVVHDGAGT